MYDPELTNYLTMIATVGLATFWAVCFMYGVVSDKVKPFEFSDKFELGYIDDDKVVDDKVVVVSESHQYRYAPPRAKTKLKKKKRNKVRSRPSPKPAPKPAPKPEVDEQLMRDCSDALVGLGEGKREAKRVSAEVLKNHPEIKTVQEFIRRVLKR